MQLRIKSQTFVVRTTKSILRHKHNLLFYKAVLLPGYDKYFCMTLKLSYMSSIAGLIIFDLFCKSAICNLLCGTNSALH